MLKPDGNPHPYIPKWNMHAFTKCDNPRWNSWLTGKYIPCRQCTRCKRRKAYSWKYKILAEVNKWQRTWFVTLTYSNTENYTYKNIQLWLKKLRKSGLKLKYVATTEYDSSGKRDYNPHHHLAIFCQNEVQRRHLETKWDGGYSTATLFKNTDAGYIAKYITKNNERVRASQGIGNKITYNHPPF